MRVVFVIDSVSQQAVEENSTISQQDFDLLQKVTTRAGVKGSIVFAVQSERFQGKKKPGIRAMREERSRVLAEIASHKPDAVVVLGPHAARALWDDAKLRVRDLRRVQHEVHGVAAPVWVTYSLGEAALKPALARWITLDVMSIKRGSTTPDKIDWCIGREPHEELLRRPSIVSVDLETVGFDPWAPDARIRMASISHRPGWGQVVPMPDGCTVPHWLADLLADERVIKVGSNIRFDVRWLERMGFPVRNIRNTITAEHVLDSSHPDKGLKALTLQYTNLGDYSAKLRDHLVEHDGDWDKLTDEEMYEYAAYDAAAGYEVHEAQLNKLAKRDLINPFYIMTNFENDLAAMQVGGACVSAEVNAELDDLYQQELARLHSEITKEFGFINPRSVPQLSEALAKKFPGIDLEKSASRRKRRFMSMFRNVDLDPEYSTDKYVLEREARLYPELNCIIEYRKKATLYSTFVKKFREHFRLIGGKHYVFTDFKTHGTVTYRPSSARPNLNNIPRKGADPLLDIKRQFISRWDGGSIGEWDGSQQELREAAMVTGDDELIAAFLAGDDIHRQVAARMFDIDIANVTDDHRQAAKTLNFMVFYGGGSNRLAMLLGCSEDHARDLIEAYYERFAGVAKWKETVKASVRQDLMIRTRWGFERHFVRPIRWNHPAGWEVERQAINTHIQNGAVCISYIGIHDALEKMRARRLRSTPILMVYDQLGMDIAPGELEEVNDIVINSMENPPTELFGVKMTVPLVADGKVGPDWASTKEIARAGTSEIR